MKAVTKSDYKVEEYNDGYLFAVVSEYAMYGNYYKTRAGAERYLIKVQIQAGEVIN